MQIRGQNQQILQVFENNDKMEQDSSESQSYLFDKVFSEENNNLDLF